MSSIGGGKSVLAIVHCLRERELTMVMNGSNPWADCQPAPDTAVSWGRRVAFSAYDEQGFCCWSGR